jgi:hypothetical protein
MKNYEKIIYEIENVQALICEPADLTSVDLKEASSRLETLKKLIEEEETEDIKPNPKVPIWCKGCKFINKEFKKCILKYWENYYTPDLSNEDWENTVRPLQCIYDFKK